MVCGVIHGRVRGEEIESNVQYCTAKDLAFLQYWYKKETKKDEKKMQKIKLMWKKKYRGGRIQYNSTTLKSNFKTKTKIKIKKPNQTT